MYIYFAYLLRKLTEWIQLISHSFVCVSFYSSHLSPSLCFVLRVSVLNLLWFWWWWRSLTTRKWCRVMHWAFNRSIRIGLMVMMTIMMVIEWWFFNLIEIKHFGSDHHFVLLLILFVAAWNACCDTRAHFASKVLLFYLEKPSIAEMPIAFDNLLRPSRERGREWGKISSNFEQKHTVTHTFI